jgi:hypothetical protein
MGLAIAAAGKMRPVGNQWEGASLQTCNKPLRLPLASSGTHFHWYVPLMMITRPEAAIPLKFAYGLAVPAFQYKDRLPDPQ